MVEEDKARSLRGTQVNVSKLSASTFGLSPKGLVSFDCLWIVIVPKPFCTFGELRHILLHFYRIDVPEHVFFIIAKL